MRPNWRLLQLTGSMRGYLAVTSALALVAGLLVLGQAFSVTTVVNAVFLGGAGLAGVQGWLALLVAVIASRALVSWASEVAASRAAARAKTNLREPFLRHLTSLGPEFVRGERSGELSNVATEGVEALDAYFSQFLPQAFATAIVPAVVVVAVFASDLLSGIVLLVTAPLLPIFMVLIGRMAEGMTRRQWRTMSVLSAHFRDVLQGLTTLKMFGRSRVQREHIARVSEQYRAATMNVLRVAFLSALVLEVGATISTAIIAVEVGLRLLYGGIDFGPAFFVLLLAPEYYMPFRALGARFHSAMSGGSAAERILGIMEKQPPAERVLTSPLPDLSTAAVRFEGVEYAYPDGTADAPPALRGVTFSIEPGTRVALVGPSGAGKSTVASLLLRFLEPSSGIVTIGDMSLSQIAPEEWRQQVAWVPQRPYLFNDTVANNIRLGRPEATMEAVIEAARAAQAHGFIAALPDGYDTHVGEQGTRLSGGQAQRIGIARALLKNAPLLVLDEATSNLDPENESLVMDATERLMQGRTVLIIAHRQATVRRATKVVALEAGRVVDDRRPATGDRRLTAVETTDPEAASDEPLTPDPRPVTAVASPVVGRRSSVVRRLLRLSAPLKWWMALAALLGFCTVGSGVGLMATSAYLISAAARHPSVATLQVAIVGVRFFGIARGAFRYAERYVSHYVAFGLLKRLRVWFYEAIEPLAPARLLQYRGGDLLARVIADIETLQDFYIRVIAPPVVALLVGVLLWVLLGAYDVLFSLVWTGFYLLAGMGVPLLAHLLGRELGREIVRARANLNAYVVDGIGGMADIVAFGAQASRQEETERLNRRLISLQERMAWVSGLQGALSTLLMNLAMWAMLVAAIPAVRDGHLDGVYLAVLLLATLAGFEGVNGLPTAAQGLGASVEAARRLFEIVDAEPAVVEPKGESPTPNGHGIEMRNLTFAYNEGEPNALEDVSLNVPDGGCVALVGPSGAGKSTVANLLLRFWDYAQGSIKIGGVELRDMRGEDARRLVSVVAQRTHLFNTTIRSNLLIARPNATEEEMWRALERAQLAAFVRGLPDGLDTSVREEGLRLSGGERQRLAIARAFLKDAPILILDEPTANLDPATEREILRTVASLAEGRTTLIISHRLVGLEMADEIVVLSHGKVIERGTEAALLTTGGLYRRMKALQDEVVSAGMGAIIR